jgi:hypothetical protein
MQNEANVNLGHLWVNAPSDEGLEGTKVNTKEKKVVPLSMQRFAASPEELQNEPTSPFPLRSPVACDGCPHPQEAKMQNEPKTVLNDFTLPLLRASFIPSFSSWLFNSSMYSDLGRARRKYKTNPTAKTAATKMPSTFHPRGALRHRRSRRKNEPTAVFHPTPGDEQRNP